jgi:DNA-binding SARP family transcriptional activator
VLEARSAEAFARAAGVPGAVAVAYGALALSSSAHASELMALADSEADAVGIEGRPWRATEMRESALRARTQVLEGDPLTVRCFGRFELAVGNIVPALSQVRPRARAVLRLLALQAGEPIHREVLIDSLWPDLHPEAATHNLHVCISSLRAALEPGVHRGASRLVVRDGDRYTLRLPPGSHCDLQAFNLGTAAGEQARAAGDVGRAIDLLEGAVNQYTGDVLPEEGPAEWVVGPREHYRMRAAEATARLAELQLSHGQPSLAAASSLRSIDIDPCHDASWRLLLAAYRESGDHAAAERARRAYADVLASLGVVTSSASAVLPSSRS